MSALSISSRFSPDSAIPHDAVPAVAKVERSAAWVLSSNYPGQTLLEATMTAANATASEFSARWDVLRARAVGVGAAALVVGGGSDLAYLTGHDGHSYERMTAAVSLTSPGASPALLVTPKLEAERITPMPEVFELGPWEDSDDPIALAVGALPEAGVVLISDDLNANHLLAMQAARPGLTFRALNEALGGMRAVKTVAERDALRTVGSLADKVHQQIQDGEVPLVGRTELEVKADIHDRLLGAGHDEVVFIIVASGPNSASPHHHPSDRVIQPGEMVLFDFGGTFNGFNSDTTRCVFTGEIPDDVAAAWTSLVAAQEAAVQAARPGNRLCDVDKAARQALTDDGYGPEFIHRTGHGIGTEVHEHPYVTGSNETPIEVGNAFSVEPGIYRVGQWGMRLEDIVVIEEGGAVRCNSTKRVIVSVS